MSLTNHLAELERRLPRPVSPYCVQVRADETALEAIARVKPRRGFFLVPAPMLSIEGWAVGAERVLKQ